MKPWRVIGITAGLLVGGALASAGAGATGWFGPWRILAALVPGNGGDEAIWVIRQLRLPRVVLAMAAGAALGLAGALMQALFRNPLAEPYVAGVSSGAAAGAVLGMAWGIAAGGLGRAAAALGGALLAVWMVRRIALRRGEESPLALLLAGVAVSGMLQAVTVTVLLRAEAHDLRSLLVWLMGSLAYRGWEEASLTAAVTVIGAGAGMLLARPLDLLAVGADEAAALGVSVRTVERGALWLACLLAAVTVATCGTVGFVGLMAPHVARALVGAGHRWVLPQAALIGALLLTAADAVARLAVPGQELPVGAVTGVLGAVFLLVLLRKGSLSGGRGRS